MQRKNDGGIVLHADLFVRSMNSAFEFYCDKLGFSVVDETLLRGPLVHSLSGGCYDAVKLALIRAAPVGAMIELLEFQRDSALLAVADDAPLPTGFVSILVTNLEAHISSAKSRGLLPTSEIFAVELPRQGSCRIIFYEDPDKNRLEFLQVARTNVRHQ